MTAPFQVSPDDVADPHRLVENRERGLEVWEEKAPSRYRDAVVSVPGVRVWVEGLLARAVADRWTVPQIRLGSSLLLAGGVGVGKTHEALAAVRALTLSGMRCPWMFTTVADLHAQLRPGARNDGEVFLRSHCKVALLVLDDIGASKSSEWTEEINYRLINDRYQNELPTLLTTNVPPRQFPATLGARVASRLTEMATTVILTGPDRRRKGTP